MIDGHYGTATRDAVKLFQKDQNLERDGKCGKNTWSRIEWYIMNSTFKIKGSWYFYELHATYYNSGNSLTFTAFTFTLNTTGAPANSSAW